MTSDRFRAVWLNSVAEALLEVDGVNQRYENPDGLYKSFDFGPYLFTVSYLNIREAVVSIQRWESPTDLNFVATGVKLNPSEIESVSTTVQTILNLISSRSKADE